MKDKILVLDIETTGFSHEKDCILELGCVSLDLETGKTRKLFDEVFREPHLSARHHNAWIFDNEFMTHEEVRESKPLSEYKDKIQSIFDKYKGKIVAWNRPFDADFLKSRGFDLGEDLPDPMRVSTGYFKIPSKGRRIGYKWPSAQEAYDALFPEENLIEKHRGFEDCKMEAKIIYELIKEGVYSLE